MAISRQEAKVDKDQLKALLKAHLSVSVDTSRGSYGSGDHLNIKIEFDGELIADSSISLSSSGGVSEWA